MVTAAMKSEDNCFSAGKQLTNLDKPRQCWKAETLLCQQRSIYKVTIFPVVTYNCESWRIKKVAYKNWRLWTVVLEKTPESSLHRKEIKSVNLNGNQPWIFTGKERLRAEGEEGVRGWDGGMASPMQWTWTWANQEMVRGREGWRAAVHGITNSLTWVSDWISTTTDSI